MHGWGASGEPLDGAVMESIKNEFSYTSSFLPWISEGMAAYSNQEKADMHFMDGLANGNALEAERLYRQSFPRIHVPERKMFERLHRCLCETGSFVTGMQATGRGRSVRAPQIVEDVLQRVEDHYTPRVKFARWFLQQLAAQPDFSAHVLFTDETTFTREGISNTHNLHVWASSNPYDTRPHVYQKRFSVNVSSGIVRDHLIGPYLLPFRLHSRTYLTFLQQVLPELLQPAAANIQARMWFQHDGEQPHFSLNVQSVLDAKFPRQWIGRGGSTHWTACSPDLSCLDSFLWDHLKSLAYESHVDSDEDLVARISVAAVDVREMPGVFKKVSCSLRRRCNACITAAGRSLEQFL
ncbi:hypothetical protein AVEN_77152-1 [Araneus ventricosus]|uniref:Uncharacterized protein n=1 Tax=Araneus ventricosus TaxID=182803 RepID=A0A4Y2UTV7_ARAVE|nr:hypothetical protein AVEN_77152-1 [Araneus ventricosus]